MTGERARADPALAELVARADLGDRQAAGRLVAALGGDPAATGGAAVTELAALDDPVCWHDLLIYLAGGGWHQQRLPPPTPATRHAMERLFVASFGQPFARRREVLRAAMAAPSPAVRALAATCVGKRRDRTALPALVELLADPAPQVRTAAAHALHALPDPRAIDALLAAMADDDLGVRLAAADALGAVGRPALIMLLRRLITRQAGAPFREAAARALLPLAVAAPRPDVAVLETALRGPAAESTVRVAADKLLRRCEVRAALSC